VSTPIRKRKLQVQVALATRGVSAESLLPGVLWLMFQRGTLIQEAGVSEDSQGGLKSKRRGLWIAAPTLQHLQEEEWENTVDKHDATVACNTGLHTDRGCQPSSRSPWNSLEVISHKYTS
jgi:hypothetical protein